MRILPWICIRKVFLSSRVPTQLCSCRGGSGFYFFQAFLFYYTSSVLEPMSKNECLNLRERVIIYCICDLDFVYPHFSSHVQATSRLAGSIWIRKLSFQDYSFSWLLIFHLQYQRYPPPPLIKSLYLDVQKTNAP